MTLKRFPNAANVSAKLLGEALKFPNGRSAPNRLMKASMSERMATFAPDDVKKHGLPTEALLNAYDKWGHGQFGMIITGNVLVCPTNLEAAGNAIIFKEGDTTERRDLYSEWARKTKQDGALAIMQISHAGRLSSISVNPTPFGASDVELKVEPPRYGKPIPLTTAQVKTEVVDRFAYAAKYAYDCGWDGVELHGAFGYLLGQFTSPTTNKRTDKYGGSLENRNRVIMEIFDEIKRLVPVNSGFLIGIKTNAKEFQNEGTTVQEAKTFCEAYDQQRFDFVELSAGTAEKFSFDYEMEEVRKREAYFAEYADEIRPALKNTVVYLTGGFRTVGAMVDAVQRNTTQGIGLARPVTAEPDLPKNILNGSVRSAVQDAFDSKNVVHQIMGSGSQIQEMGKRSWKEAGGNVMDSISDFSDQKVVAEFGQKLAMMFAGAKKTVEAKA